MHKMAKKINLVLVLIAVAIVVYVIIRPVFKVKDSNSREDFTRLNMLALSESVQLVAMDKKSQPPVAMSELVEWLGDQITGLELFMIIKDGMVNDSWGTPFVLSYPEPHTFIITSCGRNREYDNGNVDDIVYSFDPLEFVEE